MHKTVTAITTILGLLAVPVVAYAAWLGYCLGAWNGPGGLEGLTVLLVGPLSLLPAGWIGRKRPVIAGIWLCLDALFAFFMYFVADGDGFTELFQPSPPASAVGLVTAAGFVAILGIGFLWSQKDRLRTKAQSPEFRRRLLIVAVPLLVGVMLSLLAWALLIRS